MSRYLQHVKPANPSSQPETLEHWHWFMNIVYYPYTLHLIPYTLYSMQLGF
jgi:hypothetical protein